MRTSVRELSLSQAASASRTFAASVRMSYRSKSKWMSLRASIVRNSLSGGRSATVAGRLPAAGVRASARLTATLPGGADNAADGAPRRPEVRRRRGLATRDRQQDALDDPVVRPEDQAATHRRLDGEPARRHVAVPLEQRRRDREGGGAERGLSAAAMRHRARRLAITEACPDDISELHVPLRVAEVAAAPALQDRGDVQDRPPPQHGHGLGHARPPPA